MAIIPNSRFRENLDFTGFFVAMAGQTKITSSAADGCNGFSKASSASKSAIVKSMRALNDRKITIVFE